jgi:hypothetical protein
VVDGFEFTRLNLRESEDQVFNHYLQQILALF